MDFTRRPTRALLHTRCVAVLVAGAYLVIGFAAYRAILGAGFLGDDWMFLDLVARAKSASVVFAPLNSRFTRPLVVLVYYFSFHRFGLWTFPAHVLVVLLHVLNACLVYAFVLRLVPRPNQLAAAGAGLIFLLFAGHSEAVAWIAGMADAAVVPFAIGSLLLLDRAIVRDHPAPHMALAWLVAAAGLLAKETALLLPAIALVYGLLPLHAAPLGRRVRRTLVFVAGLTLVCAAYWLFRNARFGSSLAAYSGMGTSEGRRLAVARMFFLRTLVPPGRIAAGLWTHWLDLPLFAIVAAAGGWVALREKADRPGLAFLATALVIALAPALPLSISLVNTLTERYVYLATVFSCALIAWIVVRLSRLQLQAVSQSSVVSAFGPLPPLVAGAAIVVVAGVQGLYLSRSTQSWVRGDEVFRSVVDGVLAQARANPPAEASTILLLNAPDTIDRPYVDGAGMAIAIRLMSSSARIPEPHLRIAAMVESPNGDETVTVRQSGREFFVDLGPGAVVDGWLNDTDEYTVTGRGRHTFSIALKPPRRRTLVAYTTGSRVELLTAIGGVPFGAVDEPAQRSASCDGGTSRFSGWALDDEAGVSVEIEREEADTWRRIGIAEWKNGTRPDVAAAFAGYPAVDRAGWEYALPCALAGAERNVKIRIVARDRAGQQVTLGEREIRAPRPK